MLIAIGAILRYAVTASVHGINLHTVGLILMIVGIVGFIISLYWLVSRRRTYVRDERVVQPTSREVDYH